jgi:hypothetical protein
LHGVDPDPALGVNHIDDDRAANRISNLRIVTPAQTSISYYIAAGAAHVDASARFDNGLSHAPVDLQL